MANGNKSASIWQNVNGRHLAMTLLWTCATVVDGYLVSTLDSRRVRGILFAVLVVLVALLVRSFKKLMSDRLQEAIEHQLGRLLRFVFRPAAIVIGKISSWLGIGRWRGWCEDERTYLGRDKDKTARRQKRLKNDSKWSDQESNAARVRFLYIEYMIKRIRAGYLFRRQLTPDEIADELVLEDEEKLLFQTYNTVRYSPKASVSDELVDTLWRATAKK